MDIMNVRAGNSMNGLLKAKSRLQNILEKLGIRNRTGTVASARAHGLLPEPAIVRVPERIIEDRRRTIRRDVLF